MTPILAIRFAMMGGVLLFGGVTWVLHRTGEWTPAENVAIDELTLVAKILFGVVLAAGVLVFLRYRRLRDPARVGNTAILAWTLGEIVALYGGVVYYLTALPDWYLLGVILLAFSFVAFPGRRAR